MSPRHPAPLSLLMFLISVAVACSGGGGGSPTAPSPPTTPSVDPVVADAIEALFLGSGPLVSTTDQGCIRAGAWVGFRRGTTVRVRLSSAVSDADREALADALADISTLTLGALATTLEVVPQNDPLPGVGEVTFTYGELSSLACGAGCTFVEFEQPGFIRTARAQALRSLPAGAISHEVLGHGLLGLCHISAEVSGALMNSPSSAVQIRFSDLEVRAIQAVYGSSLNPGASRSDFARAGLVSTTTSG